jgi:hypothetical protein
MDALTDQEEAVATELLTGIHEVLSEVIARHSGEMDNPRLIDLAVHALTVGLATAVHARCENPEHLLEAVTALVEEWFEVNQLFLSGEMDDQPSDSETRH